MHPGEGQLNGGWISGPSGAASRADDVPFGRAAGARVLLRLADRPPTARDRFLAVLKMNPLFAIHVMKHLAERIRRGW